MHEPVLLQESVTALKLTPGATVIDGTVGMGGHAEAILEAIGPSGTLIACDRDEDAITLSRQRLRGPVTFFLCSFSDMGSVAREAGHAQVDAVLLDLGWSALQLSSGRGFSFEADEPLVMTLGKPREGELTAGSVVHTWSEHDLYEVIHTLGEERFARRIARAIVHERSRAPIQTARALGEIVASATPQWYQNKRTHAATKTFQALRMLVNGELTAIEKGVEEALALLAPGGRLAIITFHSLEDGLVKRLFKNAARERRALVITKKPVVPTRAETLRNPRARSAKLRVLEKTYA